MITTSTALSHWDIHEPSQSQSKFANAYKVSWLKSKEHPFRISALEISLGLTICTSNADPMSTLLFTVKYFCIGFQVFFLVMMLMILEKDWQLMLARIDLRSNFDSQELFEFANREIAGVTTHPVNFQSVKGNTPFLVSRFSNYVIVKGTHKNHAFIPGGENISVIYLFTKKKLFCLLSTSCLDRFILFFMMMSNTLVLQTTFQ